MGPVSQKRRRDDDVRQPKKKKVHIKKQKVYHSSSDDDSEDDTPRARDAPIREKRPPTPAKPKSILRRNPDAAAVDESEEEEEEETDEELMRNTALNTAPGAGSDVEDEDDEYLKDNEPQSKASAAGAENSESDEDVDSDSDATSFTSGTSSNAIKVNKKRNDPSAFATSISKILDTKLSTAKRVDPVLSRSKSAAEANKSLADSKLDAKARAQIRHEKRTALEKGRVRDVLGLQTVEADTGKIVEEEKRLKKTAQRGVVKLFNAVRAAQVKGEDAMRQARSEGVVGMQKREEKVNEMSKQGFLDLISSGGKTAVAA